jgi:hypothetical protein
MFVQFSENGLLRAGGGFRKAIWTLFFPACFGNTPTCGMIEEADRGVPIWNRNNFTDHIVLRIISHGQEQSKA